MLADGRRRKRIRLDDVRAGFEVLRVNLRNDLRLGQQQQLVVALEVLAFPIAEALPAVIGLLQLVALDHRAHRTVNDGDAFAQQEFERVKLGLGCGHDGLRNEHGEPPAIKVQIDAS